MTRNELSEHCLCDTCTGQDCEGLPEMNEQAIRRKVIDEIIKFRGDCPTNKCREMSDWLDIWFDEKNFLLALRDGKQGETSK